MDYGYKNFASLIVAKLREADFLGMISKSYNYKYSVSYSLSFRSIRLIKY